MKNRLKNKVQMKGRSFRFVIRLLSLAICTLYFAFLLAACSDKSAHQDTYTCPMHPTVISDKPGVCPVCAMDLVRKSKPGEEIKITEDLARLIKSPNEVVVASIRTIKGEYKSIPVAVAADGVVTYDTRKAYSIPTRVGGRLEKVYLKYAFQQIRKGQKIAEIYSPELVTAHRELLFLQEHDPENATLIASAKNKLIFLGLTNSQIDALDKGGEAKTTFAIYSPYDGYLISDQAPPSTTTQSAALSTGMGMESSSSQSKSTVERSTPESLIREGSYVSAGQTLFKIVDASALRIELDLPGSQSGEINKGDEVELDFGNGITQQTSVDFVQPFFSDGVDFLKIRVYTKKSENVHVGHLVHATIRVTSKESLWVPKEAILDLGTEQIVFVKDREVFKPMKITAGIRSNGWIEVKKGLASSDEIAATAQYLVDSESFVKPGN